MIKKVVFSDGDEAVLSPLTYQEFVALDLWSGVSDFAFGEWLSVNRFIELDQLNAVCRRGARIVIVAGEYEAFRFNRSGDHETWETIRLPIGTRPKPRPETENLNA